MGTKHVKSKEVEGLNVVKALACIVVCLHCPFPNIFGDMIIYGMRWPVPLFLMISGYFFNAENSDKMKQNMKKMLLYLLISEGLMLLLRIPELQWESADINPVALVSKLFTGTFFNGTAWYLYAMFWTYMILLLGRKWQIINKLIYLALPLLCVQIFGRLYIQNTGDIEACVSYFRSFLLYGIPFFSLGYAFKYKLSASIKKGIQYLLCGLVLMVVEYLVIGQYMDVQVSTIFVSLGIFMTALKLDSFSALGMGREHWLAKAAEVIWNVLRYIGKNLSAVVYIIHMPMIIVAGYLGGGTLIVIICSLLAAYLIYNSRRLLRIRKNQ